MSSVVQRLDHGLLNADYRRNVNDYEQEWCIVAHKNKITLTGRNLHAFEGKCKCSCSIRIKPESGAYVAAGDLDQDGRAEITTGAGTGPQNDPWVRILRGDRTSLGEGTFAYPDPVE